MVEELDDLGGISWAKDEVNPTRPLAELERYREGCARSGRELVERLPVYESHATTEWLDPIWQTRVGHFISGEER